MEVRTNVRIVKGILKKAKKENRVLNEVETSQIQKCLNEILQENPARLDFTIDAMTEVIEKMDKVGIN